MFADLKNSCTFTSINNNKEMEYLSQQSKTEFAIQMVIMDAIKKGNTDKAQLIDYMKSEVFKNAVANYLELIG